MSSIDPSYIPYALGLGTLAFSIWSSRRSSNSDERKAEREERANARTLTQRQDSTITYYRRRDLARDAREYRLVGALEDAQKPVPALPPIPDPPPDVLT